MGKEKRLANSLQMVLVVMAGILFSISAFAACKEDTYSFKMLLLPFLGMLLYQYNAKLFRACDFMFSIGKELAVAQGLALCKVQLILAVFAGIFCAWADVRIFICCNLIQYVVLLPLAILLRGQYQNKIKQRRTLVVTGGMDTQDFIEQCAGLEPAYHIQMYVRASRGLSVIEALLRIHDAVILYELEENEAAAVTGLCRKYHKEIMTTPTSQTIYLNQEKIVSFSDRIYICEDFYSKAGYTGKRIFDIVMAALVYLVTLPVQAAGIVWIKTRQHTSPFINKTFYDRHNQKRNALQLSAGEGSFLYRWGIYKLPMLLQVIGGQFSLVGTHIRYQENESGEMDKNVFGGAGIISYSQTFGKAEETDKQNELDLLYLQQESLRNDWNLFWLALRNIVCRNLCRHSDSTSAYQEHSYSGLTKSYMR